jgi:hypothetical protein
LEDAEGSGSGIFINNEAAERNTNILRAQRVLLKWGSREEWRRSFGVIVWVKKGY